MEIEYQIEFTDVVEIFVQDFDKEMNDFEYKQLVVLFVDNGDEVKTCIALVDDFIVIPLKEVAGLGIACQNDVYDLFDVFLALLSGETLRIPLCEANFALAIDKKEGVDHYREISVSANIQCQVLNGVNVFMLGTTFRLRENGKDRWKRHVLNNLRRASEALLQADDCHRGENRKSASCGTHYPVDDQSFRIV